MKVPTGVARLDELLGGGLPEGSATMVYGPPFVGKELLSRLFLLQGLREGMPAILVLTSAGAPEVRAQLTDLDPKFPEWERQGMVRYVDAYSRAIGGEDPVPGCEYVDGPVNMSALALAVNKAAAELLQRHPKHRLILDSVSTLAAAVNAQTTFRFLQVFVGKAKRGGATSLLLLDEGMHTESEVQTFKHLVEGVLHLRGENTKRMLHVEGVGLTEDLGWVEYRFTDKVFQVTGSFAAGRIR